MSTLQKTGEVDVVHITYRSLGGRRESGLGIVSSQTKL